MPRLSKREPPEEAGYVLKRIRGTDLVGAVRTVASGQSMLDPRVASS